MRRSILLSGAVVAGVCALVALKEGSAAAAEAELPRSAAVVRAVATSTPSLHPAITPPSPLPAPLPPNFASTVTPLSRCTYLVSNFCVSNGVVQLFRSGISAPGKKEAFHVCNEVTTRVRVYYRWLPLPPPREQVVLHPPSRPCVIATFWRTAGYHLLQRLIPAFKLARHYNLTSPVVLVHSKSTSRVLLGERTSWAGGAGGSYHWGLFRSIADRPEDVRAFHAERSSCFTRGVVGGWRLFESGDAGRGEPVWTAGKDFPPFVHRVLQGAGLLQQYLKPPPCASVSALLLQRRPQYGRSLANAAEAAAAVKSGGPFEVRVVEWEGMPLQQQLEAVVAARLLAGVHGNGLSMLVFLPIPAAVIQMGHKGVLALNGHNYRSLAHALGILHLDHIAVVGSDFGPNTANITLLRTQAAAAAAHILRRC